MAATMTHYRVTAQVRITLGCITSNMREIYVRRRLETFGRDRGLSDFEGRYDASGVLSFVSQLSHHM
jgi:hypothetical protein